MDAGGYFQYYEGNKMGIKTADGDVVIPAIYDFVALLSDDLFTVTEGEYTAYFDVAGNIVLPFSNKYESYGNFTQGLARVMTNEKWGFINKAGVEVIPPQFLYADEFAEGRAIVRNEEELHGAIDEQGNLVVDYWFPLLTNFENGYAKFGDLKTWGLIDKTGKIVVPQIYISIGRVYRNKVTVQVLEGEDYKEGELTIGGEVVWNNNLEHLNEFNRKKKEFAVACEQLVEEMYRSGCPCEYERFRDFIQWNQPVGFVDQELLFSAFMKKLQHLGNNLYRCEHCGACYKQKWSQYSAFLWVLNVTVSTAGNVINRGAPVPATIPVALGFYGYGIEKYNDKYDMQDIESVIAYLTKKSDAFSSQ
ncbi:WG repeat-containing protein [Niastella caeni]|uniref:WG repeat-containing protein n=1 Tax=Niastella caeni TaxID=2569763 RepID=A0A4S8HRC0_9BACT|nr:WG repeat-containing protein [Niastella caeni]THU37079.1 WG repeat-containing protein [Niastella caeni]